MEAASIQHALNTEWEVVEAGQQRGKHWYQTTEDMSIFTVDGLEVVGCSEWMRAEREVFDHIVALHNKSLKKKQGEQ
jgi:hypothetical protein